MHEDANEFYLYLDAVGEKALSALYERHAKLDQLKAYFAQYPIEPFSPKTSRSKLVRSDQPLIQTIENIGLNERVIILHQNILYYLNKETLHQLSEPDSTRNQTLLTKKTIQKIKTDPSTKKLILVPQAPESKSANDMTNAMDDRQQALDTLMPHMLNLRPNDIVEAAPKEHRTIERLTQTNLFTVEYAPSPISMKKRANATQVPGPAHFHHPAMQSWDSIKLSLEPLLKGGFAALLEDISNEITSLSRKDSSNPLTPAPILLEAIFEALVHLKSDSQKALFTFIHAIPFTEKLTPTQAWQDLSTTLQRRYQTINESIQTPVFLKMDDMLKDLAEMRDQIQRKSSVRQLMGLQINTLTQLEKRIRFIASRFLLGKISIEQTNEAVSLIEQDLIENKTRREKTAPPAPSYRANPLLNSQTSQVSDNLSNFLFN